MMTGDLKGYPMQGVRTVWGQAEQEQGINARLLERAEFCRLAGDPASEAILREATNEIDRLRRKVDDLLSYLNGISRQTAAMVKANSDS